MLGLANIVAHLQRVPRSLLTAAAFLLMLCVGLADYATGSKMSFSIFYLLPISMAAVFAGKRLAYFVSTCSALTWLTTDLWGTIYSDPLISAWNALVRLGFFWLVSFLLSEWMALTKKMEGKVRATEHELSESERRYQSLYSSMNEGVALHEIVYDESKTPTDYRILDVNPAYEVMTGLKKDQTIGRAASELYGTGQVPYLEIYSRVAATGQTDSFQTTFEPTEKTLRIAVFSLGKGQFATVLDDITEFLKVEHQLFQAQRIEGIGRLAGGIAHDFNNLLTAILGYTELLLQEIPPGDPRLVDLNGIQQAGQSAADLTRQLLAFSRKQLLQPKVLDLNEVVANMDRMLRRLIGEDVELVTLLGTDLGSVKVDPSQLEQVIVNLAVNARHAMPAGGKLTIETANAELDEAYARGHVSVTPGSYVRIAVSDTGHGMDAATKSRIFEPFFTTKEMGEGTGLGLSTVYGIVKQSGGNIWVYSEPEHGTTFKIYFPRVEEEVADEQPKIPSVQVGGTETILLVEDEMVVRNLAQVVLERIGYTVLEAVHAEEALQIAANYEGTIHLMLTDVVLPRINGRQLAERAASIRPEMAVLFMSGYTDNAIVHHGVLEPSAAFIQKPFTPNALARKVREVLIARA